MKNIDAFFSGVSAKLVCCIDFGSTSSFCSLLKSIALSL